VVATELVATLESLGEECIPHTRIRSITVITPIRQRSFAIWTFLTGIYWLVVVMISIVPQFCQLEGGTGGAGAGANCYLHRDVS
jgi:hypothetical protein